MKKNDDGLRYRKNTLIAIIGGHWSSTKYLLHREPDVESNDVVGSSSSVLLM